MRLPRRATVITLMLCTVSVPARATASNACQAGRVGPTTCYSEAGPIACAEFPVQPAPDAIRECNKAVTKCQTACCHRVLTDNFCHGIRDVPHPKGRFYSCSTECWLERCGHPDPSTRRVLCAFGYHPRLIKQGWITWRNIFLMLLSIVVWLFG
jgi:hypothetical protein